MSTNLPMKNEIESNFVTDLDGTLIYDDVTQLATKLYIKKNIFNVLNLALWLTRGIAYYKHQLAKQIFIDPKKLHYNHKFLSYIKTQKASGMKIFLATGCDEKYAKQIADYLGIFDGVLASNGITNLVAQNKANALKNIFSKNFTYAGNSFNDIAVWNVCNKSILVTPTKLALKKMKNKSYILFEE